MLICCVKVEFFFFFLWGWWWGLEKKYVNEDRNNFNSILIIFNKLNMFFVMKIIIFNIVFDEIYIFFGNGFVFFFNFLMYFVICNLNKF